MKLKLYFSALRRPNQALGKLFRRHGRMNVLDYFPFRREQEKIGGVSDLHPMEFLPALLPRMRSSHGTRPIPRRIYRRSGPPGWGRRHQDLKRGVRRHGRRHVRLRPRPAYSVECGRGAPGYGPRCRRFPCGCRTGRSGADALATKAASCAGPSLRSSTLIMAKWPGSALSPIRSTAIPSLVPMIGQMSPHCV